MTGVTAPTTREPLSPAAEETRYGFAFWVLVAFFFVEYLRPEDRIPGIAELKIGLVATILSAIAWLTHQNKESLHEPLIKLIFFFILFAGASVPFAVNNYWAFVTTESLVLVLVAAVLPSTAILAEPTKLLRFVQLWIVFHLLIALSAIRSDGKGTGSFLADENDLALVIGMAVPYAYFMAQSHRIKFRTKLFYRSVTGILVLAIIITNSRGGFVGLVASLVTTMMFTNKKMRNLFLLGATGLLLLAWVPSTYYARLDSATDPMDSTRRDRLYLWSIAWDMYVDNPVVGVGVRNFPWRAGEYQIKRADYDPRTTYLRAGKEVHSLYFELLSENGTVGALLYVSMIFLVIRKIRGVIKTRSDDPLIQPVLADLHLLAKAMLASLVNFLVAGAFISVLYYPEFWNLIGFVVALSLCTAKLLRVSEIPAVVPAETNIAH